MQKDFKLGLIIGLFVVILIFMWLAALPSSSILSRLRNIQQAQADSAATNTPAPSKSSVPPNIVIDEYTPPDTNIPTQRYHIVMKNQTLSDIAKIYYGSGARWTKIRDANPSINPDKVASGTRLYIPP